jgi:hypothetical protein
MGELSKNELNFAHTSACTTVKLTGIISEESSFSSSYFFCADLYVVVGGGVVVVVELVTNDGLGRS